MTLDPQPGSCPSSVSRRVVTIVEAMTILQVSRTTVLRMLTRGELHAVRFGRSIRIPLASIERLLGEGKGVQDGR